MRKIFVSNIVSVDGYFEDAGKGISWFALDEEFFAYSRDMITSVDLILFGRVTYDVMVAFWPNAQSEDPVVTERMNNLPKIVFSRALPAADWNNTTLLREIDAEEIIKLKRQPGKDIVILGSGQIVSALAQLGLIDEYVLIVIPVILGSGTPLFKGVHDRINLQLAQTKILSSGTAILHYRPVTK